MIFLRPIFGVMSGYHTRWFTASPLEESVWPQSSSYMKCPTIISEQKMEGWNWYENWHRYSRLLFTPIIITSCTNNILHEYKPLYGEKENKWHEIFSFFVLSVTFRDPIWTRLVKSMTQQIVIQGWSDLSWMLWAFTSAACGWKVFRK